MMQGDAKSLTIEILNRDQVAVTKDDVLDVEIVVGSLRKTYKGGEVFFDADKSKWICPVTQEETFALPAARVKAQARILWPNGDVEGCPLGYVNIDESISKEVL